MAFNWVKFPWTNLHDLNLDWIIQTVKTLEDNLTDAIGRFTEIVNTAVGAERTERIAADAEIQAEIVTGVYPAISKTIKDTLTGSGDLTIDKTGDVNISGAHVNLSNTYISAGSEQLTLHNPNSNKSMTANYNSGVLTLTNNQDSAAGVAVYPINTPADGGGDNSDFAANVGYVKTAVEAVSTALATETENRTSGDAALQSTIDNVIMPLITALQQKEIFNINAPVDDDFVGGNVTLNSTVISQLKAAISNNRFVIVTLKDTGASNNTLYLIINNHMKQLSTPGEYKIYFKDIKGEHIADIDTATSILTYSEF